MSRQLIKLGDGTIIEESSLHPMEFRMEVDFWEYPDGLFDWADDEQIGRYFKSAGKGVFRWEPGSSLRMPTDDLLIQANRETPLYPLRQPPYYYRTQETLQKRLRALQKRYKRPPKPVKAEIYYLEGLLAKWQVLARFLRVIEGETQGEKEERDETQESSGQN